MRASIFRVLRHAVLSLAVLSCAVDHPTGPSALAGPSPVAAVTVPLPAATLHRGEHTTLAATLTDRNGAPITGRTVIWSSSAPAVAEVSATGDVRALGVGTTTIRATADNGVYGEAALTIEQTPLVITEIMADPSKVFDAVGEWFELYNPADVSVDVGGWKIASNNDAVHTIAGSVVIPSHTYVVFARNGDPAVNGGVNPVYVYDAGSATLNLANNATDWLAIRDASDASVDSVFWGATPPSGASRALKDPTLDNVLMSGPNWVTSTTVFGAGDRGTPGAANDGSGPPVGGPVVSLFVTPSSITLTLGTVRQFTATARDASGAIVGAAITWSSSNTAVATIDAAGFATALTQGFTTIKAVSANGIEATASLFVPASAAVYRNHVEFGIPTDNDASDDFLIQRQQYVLSYNKKLGVPNWVSWNLNATHFGTAPRSDVFNADPLLPSDIYHVVTSDYTGSGYSRGHMVTSEERTATVTDNQATFFLTNVMPQQQDLNGGPWLGFENFLQEQAQQQNKEMYIISGGIFFDDYTTLKNEGKVAIPSYTWKIAVIMNAGQGLADVKSVNDLQVITVIMPNVTGVQSIPWQTFKCTVATVDFYTGYSFLDKLPDDIKRVVKFTIAP